MVKKTGIVIVTLISSIFAVNAQKTVHASQLKPGNDKIAAMPNPKHNSAVSAPHFDTQLAAEKENEKLAADMLDYAFGFTGVKYVWGGKTPKGFDCSGFTGYVFRQFGYEIGSCSRNQFKYGQKVENDEIKPGDLLFFGGRKNAPGVGHVAIAVSVDNETGDVTFIHASCKRGVTTSKLSESYYKARFRGARRVIGTE